MEKELDFVENENLLSICHESVQLLHRHIPMGQFNSWTPFMRRAFVDIKRQGLMPISRHINLAAPRGSKRKREDIEPDNAINVYRDLPLVPIPEGAAIPVPLEPLPEGAVVPFPDYIPTFYGRVYELNRMFRITDH